MHLWTHPRGYKSKCPTFAACVMLTLFFAICPDGRRLSHDMWRFFGLGATFQIWPSTKWRTDYTQWSDVPGASPRQREMVGALCCADVSQLTQEITGTGIAAAFASPNRSLIRAQRHRNILKWISDRCPWQLHGSTLILASQAFMECQMQRSELRSNVPIIMKAGKSLERRSTIVCIPRASVGSSGVDAEPKVSMIEAMILWTRYNPQTKSTCQSCRNQTGSQLECVHLI